MPAIRQLSIMSLMLLLQHVRSDCSCLGSMGANLSGTPWPVLPDHQVRILCSLAEKELKGHTLGAAALRLPDTILLVSMPSRSRCVARLRLTRSTSSGDELGLRPCLPSSSLKACCSSSSPCRAFCQTFGEIAMVACLHIACIFLTARLCSFLPAHHPAHDCSAGHEQGLRHRCTGFLLHSLPFSTKAESNMSSIKDSMSHAVHLQP